MHTRLSRGLQNHTARQHFRFKAECFAAFRCGRFPGNEEILAFHAINTFSRVHLATSINEFNWLLIVNHFTKDVEQSQTLSYKKKEYASRGHPLFFMNFTAAYINPTYLQNMLTTTIWLMHAYTARQGGES